jgi:hypothetical protein
MNEFINENDVNYSFKNPRDAKQFMSSAERSGLKKQNMKVSNNKVSIKRVRDKEITNILNLLAKEMKATVEEVEHENVISLINECVSTRKAMPIQLKDGNCIHIIEEDAINVSILHDNLNTDNQKKLIKMLETSYEDHEKILTFCKDNKEVTEL